MLKSVIILYMDNNEIKVKRLEIEANTISSLRNTYINILSILIGGVCCLSLLPFSTMQLAFIFLGTFLSLFFIVLIVKL